MPMVPSDDPLRAELITREGPWSTVDDPDEVDSTNAHSLRRPTPWRVVTTRHQRAGRGRHARVWASPPGSSVAVSFTVPLAPDPQAWGWLPLATGVATVAALGEVTGAPERFALKWPNDVLAADLEGRWGKVCGILCEAAPGAPDGPLVVAGIGVNVDLTAAELPVPTATSLTLAGFARTPRERLVAALARSFGAWHADWYAGADGLDRVRTAYRAACATIGVDVDVHLPGGEVVRGRAKNVADDGELEVVCAPDSTRRRFAAGDVIHLRPTAGGPAARSRGTA